MRCVLISSLLLAWTLLTASGYAAVLENQPLDHAYALCGQKGCGLVNDRGEKLFDRLYEKILDIDEDSGRFIYQASIPAETVGKPNQGPPSLRTSENVNGESSYSTSTQGRDENEKIQGLADLKTGNDINLPGKDKGRGWIFLAPISQLLSTQLGNPLHPDERQAALQGIVRLALPLAENNGQLCEVYGRWSSCLPAAYHSVYRLPHDRALACRQDEGKACVLFDEKTGKVLSPEYALWKTYDAAARQYEVCGGSEAKPACSFINEAGQPTAAKATGAPHMLAVVDGSVRRSDTNAVLLSKEQLTGMLYPMFLNDRFIVVQKRPADVWTSSDDTLDKDHENAETLLMDTDGRKYLLKGWWKFVSFNQDLVFANQFVNIASSGKKSDWEWSRSWQLLNVKTHANMLPEYRFSSDPRENQSVFRIDCSDADHRVCSKSGILGGDGRWLLKPEYDDVLPLDQYQPETYEGLGATGNPLLAGAYAVKQNNMAGIVDSRGQILLAPMYPRIRALPKQGLLFVVENAQGEQVLVDGKGTPVASYTKIFPQKLQDFTGPSSLLWPCGNEEFPFAEPDELPGRKDGGFLGKVCSDKDLRTQYTQAMISFHGYMAEMSDPSRAMPVEAQVNGRLKACQDQACIKAALNTLASWPAEDTQKNPSATLNRLDNPDAPPSTAGISSALRASIMQKIKPEGEVSMMPFATDKAGLNRVLVNEMTSASNQQFWIFDVHDPRHPVLLLNDYAGYLGGVESNDALLRTQQHVSCCEHAIRIFEYKKSPKAHYALKLSCTQYYLTQPGSDDSRALLFCGPPSENAEHETTRHKDQKNGSSLRVSSGKSTDKPGK